MIERYTLFTNLNYVTIGPVRTNSYALLLCDGEGLPGRRQCKVRGFGTDPAWPTFDIFVDSIEYTMHDAQGNLFKLKDDGSMEATIVGAILTLKDGPKIEIVSNDRTRSIDIQTFEGESGVILEVWEALKKKVPEYWAAPNMPTLLWRRADEVRRNGVEGVRY